MLTKVLEFFKVLVEDVEIEAVLSDFAKKLRADLEATVPANDQIAVQQFFKKAFQAAQAQAADLFPDIWRAWMKREQLEPAELAPHLWELAATLKATPLGILLQTRLGLEKDLPQLFQAIAAFCLQAKTEISPRLAQLWCPLLAAALTALSPQKIAPVLLALMNAKNGPLSHKISIKDLNLPETSPPDAGMPQELASPSYALPAAVMLLGFGFQALLQHANFPENLNSITADPRASFSAPLKKIIQEMHLKLPSKIELQMVLPVFLEFIRAAQKDENTEITLLKMVRFTPVGILLVISSMLHCLMCNPVPWVSLLFKNIEADPNFKIKRLPAPAPGGPKYLIFSDIHRDARSDRCAPFEIGSIAHFSSNQQLYCELLDYALKQGYTVIEAGDCDELWNCRDISVGSENRLQEIIETHQPVYDRLIKLHRKGRYVRLYGNHDADVRKPGTFQRLQQIFETRKKPFAIYDFAIIDAVKTMDESVLNVGLDSEPYRQKAPMIVMHGHQFDFFNCDENHIIGKLIVASIATSIDIWDDPLIDIGGIAYAGSPAVIFADILANAFVLNNYPRSNPARRLAHRIQHLDDFERQMVDDVYFFETIAALGGATLQVRTQADSQETRRGNLICLGHTHYPQSQPYYNIKRLLPYLGDWLSELEAKVKAASHDIIKPNFGLVKSRYFNSGTAGWMEGVIWAIQIDETGQARLVYWTRETRPECPQTMDWELPRMDDARRAELEARKGKIINTIEDLSTLIDPLIDSALTSILRSIAIVFDDLISHTDKVPALDFNLDTTTQSPNDALSTILLTLFGSKEPRTHTIKIPLPKSIRPRFDEFKKILANLGTTDPEEQNRFASAWYLVSHRIPFLGKNAGQLNQTPEILDPNLQWFLSLALHLAGTRNPYLPIQSSINLENDTLVFRITTQPFNGK